MGMSVRVSRVHRSAPQQPKKTHVASAADAHSASAQAATGKTQWLARLGDHVRAGAIWVVTRLTRAEWGFVALLIFCYGYFVTPAGTNTISRYDMIYALMHGPAIIDPHAGNTIDISFYHGHYYSPRSLGLSLLAVPILFIWSHITNIDQLQSFKGLTIQIAVLSAFTVMPACVVGALTLKRFVERLRPQLAETPLPMVVAGAFALGTIAFPFGATLFSEAFGGALAFIGFYLIYRARSQPQPWRRVFVGGLLVGFAVISEYPVGLVMLILFGYVLVSFAGRRLSMLLTFLAGIAPSALLLGWYNWFAFGNPLNLSYGFVTDQEFSGQHQGFFGITLPHPDGLWAILVYPRGILLESPFLLLIPLGLARWLGGYLRQQRLLASSQPTTRLGRWWRWLAATPEGWVALAMCVLYPLVISSYFIPMAGENLPGPRLLTPLLPFACLALIWVVDDARRWVRWFFSISLCYAVALAFIFVASGVRELSTYQAFPIADLYWPVMHTGYVPAQNGMTPPNIGVLWFALPQGLSLYVALAPLAIWTFFAVRAIIRTQPGNTGNVSAVASEKAEAKTETTIPMPPARALAGSR